MTAISAVLALIASVLDLTASALDLIASAFAFTPAVALSILSTTSFLRDTV